MFEKHKKFCLIFLHQKLHRNRFFLLAISDKRGEKIIFKNNFQLVSLNTCKSVCYFLKKVILGVKSVGVTGFMVGSKSEHAGIIKDGAKMVNAVSNSVVPKFTVIIGNSYGAGNYAMCGKAYDPRLIVAWPSAELAVMSGESAAKVLLQIETVSLKKRGEKITPEKEAELFDQIKSRYDQQISPYYSAARIWTDAVINPLDTRTWISMGIEAANHAPIEKQFNMGVLQV